MNELLLSVVLTTPMFGDMNLNECDGRRNGLSTSIRCDVTNGSDSAVETFEYRIVLFDPNRTFPWSETERSAHIPGGIEPGETVPVHFLAHPLPSHAGSDVHVRIEPRS